MKYIRTEDKIYERMLTIRTLDREDNETEVGVINDKGQVDEILAQADTIEDLIDTLVVCFDNNIQPVLCGYSKFQSKLYAGDRGHIMGAIWTDKGLIYVAKMNDKGELELL